jgi:hypothetical protein
MLQPQNEAQECSDRAAEARSMAEQTTDPALKAELLDMEQRWAALSRRIAGAASLADLGSERSDWRRIFGEPTRVSAEPDDVLRLQEISSFLVQEDDLSFYGRIVDAAISLVSAHSIPSDASCGSWRGGDFIRNQRLLGNGLPWTPARSVVWPRPPDPVS